MRNPFIAMKPLLCALLASISLPAVAGTLIEQHTDVRFNYDAGSDTWEGVLRFGPFNNPNSLIAPEVAVLPAPDFPSPAGKRFTQPAGTTFAFTGAQPGAPLWIFTQADTGGAWPGLANTNTPGALAAYVETDPRVATLSPERWIRMTLESMNYSGEATGPQFSMWQTGGSGQPTVWMRTDDGISAGDAYYFLEAGHSHMNWGFTALGIYQLGFRASGFKGSDGTPTESEVFVFNFAIGTFATWRGIHYEGPDLVDEEVSGPESDSDGDGVKLLVEYALNMSPVVPNVAVMTPTTGTGGLPLIRIENVAGQDRLTMEFVRRKATTNPQIEYAAEFSGTLENGSWSQSGTESATWIDGAWERVKVTDSVNLDGQTKRFGRLKVTLLPAIAY